MSQKNQPAVADALNALLADSFALYLKTKNYHWHVQGPRFRELHLLFDEQAGQIFATTDLIAERVRKIGRTTLRSIGQIKTLQRVLDSDPMGYWESPALKARICQHYAETYGVAVDPARILQVYNKADTGTALTPGLPPDALTLSAKTGAGLDALRHHRYRERRAQRHCR